MYVHKELKDSLSMLRLKVYQINTFASLSTYDSTSYLIHSRDWFESGHVASMHAGTIGLIIYVHANNGLCLYKSQTCLSTYTMTIL